MLGDGREPVQFLKPRNTLLMLATVAVVVAWRQHNPQLVMLAVGAVSAYAMAWWQSRGLLTRVRAERRHHERAFQDNTVAVSLDVSVTEGSTPELLLVEDHFPAASTSRVRRLVEEPTACGTTVEIHYFGSCDHRRGIYILGPVRFEAADALGFFSREHVLDCFTTLVVYPQAVDLMHHDLLGDGTLAHVGLETTPRTGLSEEFIGVREYRPGDSPRVVHWRSTARHGRPMVKEFNEERTTLVTLFLDLGRLGLVGIGDQTSVEYGIKVCASLAKRAVERGHSLQLFAAGRTVEHIPPGAGIAHLLTVLDRLALLKPEGESGFLAVVGDMVRELPRGSTAVLIQGATTVDFDQMAPLVSLLLDRRVLPVVVLVDDRAFIKIFAEQEQRHIDALPLEVIAENLTLLGARVHVIQRARSMAQALLQGLEAEAVHR